ncbi:hypothetical protein OS493_025631 [Desmophyllum pertusum]|uniref:Uncharacterized protein n=1 Tax=Desmophyllum pertusum TaxID=174260 RepID=A0A9W9ZZJ2_9CNID|nr:hypothetical protein OS493_025631 [Desmophyllum pertusum]
MKRLAQRDRVDAACRFFVAWRLFGNMEAGNAVYEYMQCPDGYATQQFYAFTQNPDNNFIPANNYNYCLPESNKSQLAHYYCAECNRLFTYESTLQQVRSTEIAVKVEIPDDCLSNENTVQQVGSAGIVVKVEKPDDCLADESTLQQVRSTEIVVKVEKPDDWLTCTHENTVQQVGSAEIVVKVEKPDEEKLSLEMLVKSSDLLNDLNAELTRDTADCFGQSSSVSLTS